MVGICQSRRIDILIVPVMKAAFALADLNPTSNCAGWNGSPSSPER